MTKTKQESDDRGSLKAGEPNGKSGGKGRLKKELSLFDVYVISTGAMFSSGFFLLPGLATAEKFLMTGFSAS